MLAPRAPPGDDTHYHPNLSGLRQRNCPPLCTPRPGRRLYLHLSQTRCPPESGDRKARCPCGHRVLGEARRGHRPREGGTLRGSSRGRFFLSKKDLTHKDTDPQPQLQAGQALRVFSSKHVATKSSTRFKMSLKVSFRDTVHLPNRIRLTVTSWHWNGSVRQKGCEPARDGHVTERTLTPLILRASGHLLALVLAQDGVCSQHALLTTPRCW